MIASRRPRGRKCSAARMMACSKSGCSNSRMVPALLRLPPPRISQRGKNPEIKPGEGIQGLPQRSEGALGSTNLLADSAQHRADARGLGWRNLEQPLEAPGLTKVLEQS